MANWLQGSAQAQFCDNATYSHRIDDPTRYNFCAVPRSSYDAVLFGALAVLAACLLHFSSLSAVLVLVAGAAAEALVFPFNLGRVGNAVTLWLGINPPELFFYVFLPPLLLDSALSIDWYVFKKVKFQVLAFAFLIVIFSGAMATPFLLYGLNLAQSGWRWQHGALFSAMLASTDAVAITSVLHKAGGPENLVMLMEGESLLNDASALTLFKLMLSLVQQIAAKGDRAADSPLAVLPPMALDIVRLSVGGAGVGFVAGCLTSRLVRTLRWHGASAAQESAAILSLAYLTYYSADALLGASGVVAVVIFGLWGNAHAHFDLGSSPRLLESQAVQRTVAFALNGIVFFFAGAACVNFSVRAAETLQAAAWNFAAFPAIYVAFLVIRGVCIALFNPMFKLLGESALTPNDIVFATWSGLRGALSLIMAQAVVTDSGLAEWSQGIVAQMGLWTALFVLSTLVINAPLIPAVLRLAGLVTVTPLKKSVRAKAKRALLRFTKSAVDNLKQEEDEMMRGVDWAAVERYVDLSDELPEFSAALEPSEPGSAAAFKEKSEDSNGIGGLLRGMGMSATEQRQGSAAADSGTGFGLRLPAIKVDVLTEEDLAGEPREDMGSSTAKRAAALSQLSRPSPMAGEPSRQLLGSMRQHVGGRWERAVQSPRGVPSNTAFGSPPSQRSAATGAAGGGSRGGRRVTFAEDSWPAAGDELEQPLLSRFTVQTGGGGAPSPFAGSGDDGVDKGSEPFAALDMPLGSEWAGSSHTSLAENGGGSSATDLMRSTEIEVAEGAELPAQLTDSEELPRPDTADVVQQLQQQARMSWQAATPPAPAPARPPQEGREAILGRRSMRSAAGDGAHKGPWGAGAELLQHSFSTPLLSDSAPREQGQTQEEEGGGGAEAGGLAGVTVHAGHPHAGGGGWSPEVLGEARRRLLAGLKRYFAAKRGEGLLSAEGLRCLNHACDVAFDRTGNTLDVWGAVEAEVVGGWGSRLVAWAFIALKRLSGRLPRWLRPFLLRPLRAASGALGAHLSRSMLVACECAVELAMSLSWSPAALWLREAEQAAGLQAEMAAEIHAVTQFIVDRELEAPQRFQAIQSYRAAMAVLRQQERFVAQLFCAGVLDAAEKDHMLEPVAVRRRQLELRGPTWRAPSVLQVLKALPFLHHVPEPVFQAVVEQGSLRHFAQDDVIWSPQDAAGDITVVVYGLVQSSFTDHHGRLQEYFLGSGGLIGLLPALTGEMLPGSGPAVALRSSMHRGPVCFTIPQAVVRALRRRAAGGDRALQQLELDMFRVAALYVVDRTKGDVGAEVAAQYQRAVAASHPPRGRRQHSPSQPELPAEGEVELSAEIAGLGAPPSLPASASRGEREKRRSDRSAIAFSHGVLADIRHQLRDAEPVHLAPGAQHAQRGHLVLLQGSFSRSTMAELQEGTEEVLEAPAVVPWIWPRLESIAALRQGVSPQSVGCTAGPRGAVLLACTEPASSDSEASSPQVSAAGLEPFAVWQDSVPDEGSSYAAAKLGEDEGQRQMRREKSATLALSASMFNLEAKRVAPPPG